MSTPDLTFTRLAGAEDAATVLVVGPSLGTAVAELWTRCAGQLAGDVEVLGWDLPGHGSSLPTAEAFSVADLADAVRRTSAELAAGRPATYAGVSLGGAVGLTLALDPGPFRAFAVVASAPLLGDPTTWHERAATVRHAGTAVMVAGSAERWFAPGFADREPDVVGRLLTTLTDSDAESYARCCEALAAFDLREALAAAGTTLPVLLVPGEHDPVVPPDRAVAYADGMAGARVEVVPGVSHQPPAEDPVTVARILTDLMTGVPA